MYSCTPKISDTTSTTGSAGLAGRHGAIGHHLAILDRYLDFAGSQPVGARS
jgi:hypothetical protein